MTNPGSLAALYRDAHNTMRNAEGLQPQEAFDELLKYLYFREINDTSDEKVALARTLNYDGGFRMGDAEAAAKIRTLFGRYVRENGSHAKLMWPTPKFGLSDATLLALHELFIGSALSSLGVDVRSAALRLFLGPELRRGLGIFLTPDEVVRAIVGAAAPKTGAVVFDPACGTGTFLVEVLREWRTRSPRKALTVFGNDINIRMLLTAHLNISPHANFTTSNQDFLSHDGENLGPNTADFIFTNPPFGVYVDPASVTARRFSTAATRSNTTRLQSEVLFIEQCLRWLKPGGLLSIVVPRSVVTNDSLSAQRRVIDELGALVGVINLPPETFAATGTQTTTAVLFLRKHEVGTKSDGDAEIPFVDVTNVGYDATGRVRPGSQLAEAAASLRASWDQGAPSGLARAVRVPGASRLSAFADAAGRRASSSHTSVRIGDLAEVIQTGRTPPRAAYVPVGIFTVKVGNLTGQGIDWSPRDRNFVAPDFIGEDYELNIGDILLTSSAHNVKYIAQKVDIVHKLPEMFGGRATFTGEVMRIRPKAGVDPFELLGILRHPEVREAMRAMVRGQTAHLRPRDVVEISVARGSNPRIAALLRREAEIAWELNLLAAEQRAILGLPSSIDEEASGPM